MPGAISQAPAPPYRLFLRLSVAGYPADHFVLEAQQMDSIAFSVNGKPASFGTPWVPTIRR